MTCWESTRCLIPFPSSPPPPPAPHCHPQPHLSREMLLYNKSSSCLCPLVRHNTPTTAQKDNFTPLVKERQASSTSKKTCISPPLEWSCVLFKVIFCPYLQMSKLTITGYSYKARGERFPSHWLGNCINANLLTLAEQGRKALPNCVSSVYLVSKWREKKWKSGHCDS